MADVLTLLLKQDSDMTDLPQHILLRAVQKPDDFAALAEVMTAAQPQWPVTPELLLSWDEARDPALFNTDIVAEVNGEIVGTGHIGHDDFAFEEWRYFGRINVHPKAEKQGVGSAIYTELMTQVQARGAREIQTMISDQPEMAAGRAFLQQRQFNIVWERYESRLNTSAIDLVLFKNLLGQVTAEEIELRSLADLATDPQRNFWLWELDWELIQDVPMGITHTKRPLEHWVKQELEDPTLHPELSFVAIDNSQNDPLVGPYIGYSTLGRNPAGFYYIGMTGVRKDKRGKGIAKALKVAAMQALHAAGGGEIRTFNDPPNKAMLGMNAALGFKQEASHYIYALPLDGGLATETEGKTIP